MIRRVPRSLAANDIEKKVNLMEESQDAKFFFFDLIFNILMLWGKCMPIAFKFRQCLFCILTNCQTYSSHRFLVHSSWLSMRKVCQNNLWFQVQFWQVWSQFERFLKLGLTLINLLFKSSFFGPFKWVIYEEGYTKNITPPTWQQCCNLSEHTPLWWQTQGA